VSCGDGFLIEIVKFPPMQVSIWTSELTNRNLEKKRLKYIYERTEVIAKEKKKKLG
jgi:hypothetical protein